MVRTQIYLTENQRAEVAAIASRKSTSSLQVSAARATASSEVRSISVTPARPWSETTIPRDRRISYPSFSAS